MPAGLHVCGRHGAWRNPLYKNAAKSFGALPLCKYAAPHWKKVQVAGICAGFGLPNVALGCSHQRPLGIQGEQQIGQRRQRPGLRYFDHALRGCAQVDKPRPLRINDWCVAAYLHFPISFHAPPLLLTAGNESVLLPPSESRRPDHVTKKHSGRRVLSLQS